jgi:Family of unknown function (DUF6232)
MSALSQPGEQPGRIYYPLRRGVAVSARDLQVGPNWYAIDDLSAVGWRRGPQRSLLQLWAVHRGVPTLLWISRDATEFRQVCRAIQRAIEAKEERTYG